MAWCAEFRATYAAQKPTRAMMYPQDKAQAKSVRASIVAPAQRSAAAMRKALTTKTDDGLKALSFQTLLCDLATIVKNRIQPKDQTTPAFDMITTPTTLQQKALDVLGVALRLQ